MRFVLGVGAASYALIALSCSEVLVVPEDGGGGQGAGDAAVVSSSVTATAIAATASVGGSGGGPPGPSTIEIALEASDGFGGILEVFDASSVTVYLNDAQGGLKASFSGAELPVEVEVADGDLVSYRWDDTDDTNHHLESYRVTPQVYRIVHQVLFIDEPWCDAAPMELTVTFPDVSGADEYFVATDTLVGAGATFPGSVTFPVVACDGDFDLFAHAKDGDTTVRYEVVQGLPFTAGGMLTVPLSLPSTETRVLAVEAAPLDDAEGFNAYAVWYGAGVFVQEGNAFAPPQDPPGPSFLFAPSLIAPASGFGVTRSHVNVMHPADDAGRCPRSSFMRSGGTDELLLFDPKRLSRPRAAGDGTWEVAEDGEVGDTIWINRNYGRFEEWTWRVRDDASTLVLGGTLPELPQGIDWTTGLPTDVSVGHWDVHELDGYAAVIGTAYDSANRTTESRYTIDCP